MKRLTLALILCVSNRALAERTPLLAQQYFGATHFVITRSEMPDLIEECRVKVGDGDLARAVNNPAARCRPLLRPRSGFAEVEARLPEYLDLSVGRMHANARFAHVVVGGGMGLALAAFSARRSASLTANPTWMAMLAYAFIQIARGLTEEPVRVPRDTVAPLTIQGELARVVDFEIFEAVRGALALMAENHGR